VTKPDNAAPNATPNAVGHKNPITAVITALSDMVSEKGQLAPMGADERLDGKTALVTGANTGLGKAIAIQLAQRGAHVVMACRSGHPEAGEDVKAASGSDKVEMLRVDLSDLNSANALCDQLKARDQLKALDITIFNAGLMPLSARHGPQGFELMFTVHFLASRLMVQRLLSDNLIAPEADPTNRPRIVFVSSESHRSAGTFQTRRHQRSYLQSSALAD
jgi:NAD(P)-dependent dehydrogenase (short-subunit alcohol dehydrogenase family)